MKDFFNRREKLVDNIPLRIPPAMGKNGTGSLLESGMMVSEHPEPKAEESRTLSKVFSQGPLEGLAPLSPLAKKIVNLLASETAVVGKEDRQLLETLLKILKQPGFANEETSFPVKASVTNITESPASAGVWQKMISHPGLSPLSDWVKPEVGSRWVQGIASLSQEAAKSTFFGEQTFVKSFSNFFESQIRSEVYHKLSEAPASAESVEKLLGTLKEALFAFGEEKMQTETSGMDMPSPKAFASPRSGLFPETPPPIYEDVGENKVAVPKGAPLLEGVMFREGSKRPSEGFLEPSVSSVPAKGEREEGARFLKETSIGREAPTSDIKEGLQLPLKEVSSFLQPYERVLHIGNNAQYDMIYAGFVDLGNSVFHVDLFHNRKPSGGYAADDIYRVIIEAETERLGTVLVDTFSSNEQLDIVLYTEPQYGLYLTSHSHTLIQRLREDGFSVRLFQIKSLLEKGKVVAQRTKMISGTERGFSRFA